MFPLSILQSYPSYVSNDINVVIAIVALDTTFNLVTKEIWNNNKQQPNLSMTLEILH